MKLLKGSGPAARKMLIAQLRPRLEPRLSQQGLQWSDVQSMFASVDLQEELRQALNDPETLLKNLLAGAGGSVPFVCVNSFLYDGSSTEKYRLFTGSFVFSFVVVFFVDANFFRGCKVF